MSIVNKISRLIREEDRAMVLVGPLFCLVILGVFLSNQLYDIGDHIVLHVFSILIGFALLVFLFRKFYIRLGKDLATFLGVLGWILSVGIIVLWIVIASL